MAKYLLQASYTAAGTQGLLKEGGTSRRSTVEQVIRGMGGTLDAFYYAFGDDDVFVIADLPDHASATAVSLAVNGSGAVTAKITVLITPEEVDEATKKTVGYRPPGG